MPQKSKTDWVRVKGEAASDALIPYGLDDGPYDPNDEATTEAYLANAVIRRPGQRGPQKMPTKELISIRLSPEVVEYFRASGEGWQGRINGVLMKYVQHQKGRRAETS